MSMTKKQYRELESKGKIRIENRQIKEITLTGIGHCGNIEVLVELVPLEHVADYHNYFKIPFKRLNEFLEIFVFDDKSSDSNIWKLSDFNKKYCRLCWYVTPTEEEHELSDPEYLYAVKHITDDQDVNLFVMQGY